jgi:hypothetical protein
MKLREKVSEKRESGVKLSSQRKGKTENKSKEKPATSICSSG